MIYDVTIGSFGISFLYTRRRDKPFLLLFLYAYNSLMSLYVWSGVYTGIIVAVVTLPTFDENVRIYICTIVYYTRV